VTKLRESCGAIVGWYHRIVIPDDVIGFGGDVPNATMSEIDRLVRADLANKMSGEFATFRQVFDELFQDGI
jgi:predicted alpha/beta hydrolase